MKPIKLIFQAFGPFAARQEVNFDELGQAPLFLINGPTGAGKSTLLDAICFALYGETTGSERTGDQMRCDQAQPSQLTQVEFTFALGGKQYRIERSPEQQVPKQRGEGTTKKTHSAALYQITDGEEQLLVNRPNPVAKYVIELMGLDVKQFRQVMVIPQGRFRELLTANSKEREQIFGQLFSTHIYRDIERILFEQAADIRKQKEQFDNQIKGVLELAEVESEQDLTATISAQAPLVEQASSALSAAKKAQEVAQAALQQGQEVSVKFASKAKLKLELEQLEQQSEAMNIRRTQLHQARQATGLVPASQALSQAQVAHRKALEAHQQAHAQLTLAKAEHEQQGQGLQVAKTQAESLTELEKRRFQLEARVDQLSQFDRQQHALRTAEQGVAEHEQTLAQQQAQLQQQEQQLKALTEQLDQAKQSALTLPLLEQQAQAISEQLSTLSEVATTQTALEQCQANVMAADVELARRQQAFNQHKQFADQQEYQWHSTQAAQLAQLLEDGVACPVCGSDSHPKPALAAGSLVTKVEVDAARAQQQQSLVWVEEQQQACQAQQIALSKVEKALEGWQRHLDSQLSQEAQTLQQQAQELDKQIQHHKQWNVEQASKALSLCQQQITQQQARLQNQEQANKVALQDKTMLEGQIANLRRTLGDENLDLVATKQAQQSLVNQIGQLKVNLERAQTEFNRSAQALTAATTLEASTLEQSKECQKLELERQEQWQQALNQSEFDSDHAFQQAVLSEEQVGQIQADLTAFDQLLAKNAGALQQLSLELTELQQPDLERLATELESLRQSYQQALTEHTQVQGVATNLNKVKLRLAELYQQNDKLDKAYQVYGTLSDVANGKTGSKVSLHRFVLGVLLDDVLIQATQRLRVMSKGRYELLRREQRAKGNVGSGLDLLVEDAYSGKTRDVATLSGGESFMAALSLALGLSDVVQSYSGGIRLDTLFIDEGFGSLDPESLDLAIQTLMELQQSGRTIGIISHVSELKEQMNLRIDVTPSRAGSQLSVVR